ncbi:MAG: enoyl-CoA hydratase/isomerase family protein [Myxococcaceae bacterium]
MDVERRGAVALLRMRAGKANAIGPAFLDALQALLDSLVAVPPGALVLIGEGRAFSAGLDLPALVDLPEAALTDFIHRFSATMLRVFTLPFPVVAAVNGHAVAGGCVLALQADQRLMAQGEARIGLNEVRLGIGLPVAVVETLRCQVPAGSLFSVAAEGGLFTPDEALRLGLVHAVVSPEALLERALERATALAALPSVAFAQVKASLRHPALANIEAAGPTDAAGWVRTFAAPEAQRLLRDVVARLTKRG